MRPPVFGVQGTFTSAIFYFRRPRPRRAFAACAEGRKIPEADADPGANDSAACSGQGFARDRRDRLGQDGSLRAADPAASFASASAAYTGRTPCLDPRADPRAGEPDRPAPPRLRQPAVLAIDR